MIYKPVEARALQDTCREAKDRLGCENCHKCRYAWRYVQLTYAVESFPVYACWYLPNWGKPLRDIDVCPKNYSDGTLRSICHVNTR